MSDVKTSNEKKTNERNIIKKGSEDKSDWSIVLFRATFVVPGRTITLAFRARRNERVVRETGRDLDRVARRVTFYLFACAT